MLFEILDRINPDNVPGGYGLGLSDNIYFYIFPIILFCFFLGIFIYNIASKNGKKLNKSNASETPKE